MWDARHHDMPKRTGQHPKEALTAVAVRRITEPGRYADGNGLHLVVDSSGSKRWLLRVVIHGKRRDMGLGGLATVSLAEARELARKYRKTAREGGDPIAQRKKESQRVPTFKELAEKIHEQLAPSWKNPKHADQWIKTLQQYAFPHFGGRLVTSIMPNDVTAALAPIWYDKPETARRVRQRIRLVMDAAIESKYRTDNPALVKVALGKNQAKPKHHGSVPYSDVPEFIHRLRNFSTDPAIKRALEFLILTATRTNEVIGAAWVEVDMDNAVWTIPAERMKAKVEHRVPLSDEAMALLKQAREDTESEYLFPGRSEGKPLSNMAMLQVMRRMGAEATVHGFRSSFRVWTEERTNYPNNVCESALAHTVRNKAERAYRRTDHLEQRRGMMQTWAQFVTGGSADVVQLRHA